MNLASSLSYAEAAQRALQARPGGCSNAAFDMLNFGVIGVIGVDAQGHAPPLRMRPTEVQSWLQSWLQSRPLASAVATCRHVLVQRSG